jgi:hypothetical protein
MMHKKLRVLVVGAEAEIYATVASRCCERQCVWQRRNRTVVVAKLTESKLDYKQ